MFHGWLAALPEWLLVGLALGAVVAAAVAAVFVAGVRLLPAGSAPGDPGESAGEGRRRAEIRAYLGAIGEPFVEDSRVAGQRVAFLLTDRDVAITFDARVYFRLERAGLDAVLVEHEMPGAGLGARLPFETPGDGTAGRNAATAGATEGSGEGRRPVATGADATRAALSVLGLPPDADREAVRAAYRERVKEVHPDHGGDPEAFRRVREAYTVARDALG